MQRCAVIVLRHLATASDAWCCRTASAASGMPARQLRGLRSGRLTSAALQSGGCVHACRDRIDRGWRIATAQCRFQQWDDPGVAGLGHVRTPIAASAFQRMQGTHAAPATLRVTTTKRLFEPERCGRIGRNRNTADIALRVVGRARDGAPAHLPTVIPPGPPLDPSPAPGSPRHPTAPVGPAGSWRSCAAPAHHRR